MASPRLASTSAAVSLETLVASVTPLESGDLGRAITIANPVMLFAVLAVVASFSHVESHLDAYTIITGIAFGSTLWWLTLSGSVSQIRGLFTDARIIFVNRVTAVALTAIAVWAISSGIRLWLK